MKIYWSIKGEHNFFFSVERGGEERGLYRLVFDGSY